jgi:hypothetical protein
MSYPYSAKLQALAEALLEHHRASSEETQVRLHLEGDLLLSICQLPDRRQVRLSQFVAVYHGPPIKKLEIVFCIDEQGHWIPYQFYRPPIDNQVCGVVDTRSLKLVIDNPSYQRALAHHCDLWAARLHNQGWLERGMRFDSAELEFESEFSWPIPTVEEPDDDQIEAWLMDDIAEATDGCQVELDGTCPHGHPSWLRRVGLV